MGIEQDRRHPLRRPKSGRRGILISACLLTAAFQPSSYPASPASPQRPLSQPLLPRKRSLPTLFLVGDSTVHNGDNGQVGWGEPIADYFDPAKINLVNRALGGRSSRTYQSEGHWEKVTAMLKPGDVVLIQFGHNDGGPVDEPTRARASLPGTGEETREIDNPLLHRRETVHTFGWYLRRYVAETMAKGATPVLCSPVPMNLWKGGRVVRVVATYGGWARQVAVANKADFVDLNEIVGQKYDQLGPDRVGRLFTGTQTVHTSEAGAELNAESVVEGLKALPIDPLAQYFSAKGVEVPAASIPNRDANPGMTGGIYNPL